MLGPGIRSQSPGLYTWRLASERRCREFWRHGDGEEGGRSGLSSRKRSWPTRVLENELNRFPATGWMCEGARRVCRKQDLGCSQEDKWLEPSAADDSWVLSSDSASEATPNSLSSSLPLAPRLSLPSVLPFVDAGPPASSQLPQWDPAPPLMHGDCTRQCAECSRSHSPLAAALGIRGSYFCLVETEVCRG